MSIKKDFSRVMPLWGPYSKKYMGLSRIVENDKVSGVRFDCVAFPTRANSGHMPPNVTVPSNYHPFESSPDLHYFSYRCELEWKDKIYADVSFSYVSDTCRLIRVNFVNNSDLCENCLVNLFQAIEYPHKKQTCVTLPDKAFFHDALMYESYIYAKKRPWDMLNPDGAKKGEFFDNRFIGGKGLGDRVDNSHVPHLNIKPFGYNANDMVTYELNIDKFFENSVMAIRYYSPDGDASFNFNLDGQIQTITFPQTEQLNLLLIPIGCLSAGIHSFSLCSQGGGWIELDCFIITEAEDCEKISIEQEICNVLPKININDSAINYKYENIQETFSVKVFSENIHYRSINTGCLEDGVISRLSNADISFDDVVHPFTNSFLEKHSDDGFYHNIIAHSIYVKPKSNKTIYALVFEGECPNISTDVANFESIYEKCKASAVKFELQEDGKQYEFSNNLLSAATMTNVVYPIYKNGGYIVHHTPGKRWDCLYTWDSGFIGLGLLEYAPYLAEYILDTYLSKLDNKDFAFLHHGSPVPVHIYLYLEMLNSVDNKEHLYTYYDRAKMMYDFLRGNSYGSTTNRFKSGLTSTYDYFYNAGGMDDLPPQVYMHKLKLQGDTSPCLAASHVIRTGKILRMVATKLGKFEDVKSYNKDIETITKGLQQYAWDEESGYFSYVVHDKDGTPKQKLTTTDGENINKGMDGIYPLIAGVCTLEQEERILQHLKSEKEMFSSVGISAVDMSASYYKHNGYWNGNVWFAHQWFIWKTMLDINQGDFAFKIAKTALNAWKTEVDSSYNTFEMINIETGRGGWFHQFGGLSNPINIWVNAYYKQCTITTGFNIWIDNFVFENKNTKCTINFENFSEQNKEKSLLIVVMAENNCCYKAQLNGKDIVCKNRTDCTLEIEIPTHLKKGELIIIPKTIGKDETNG